MNCKFARLLVPPVGPVSVVVPMNYSLQQSYITCFTDVKHASSSTTEDYRSRPLVYSCFFNLLC